MTPPARRGFFLSGHVERDGEVVHVIADRLDALHLPAGKPLETRSRDFH